MNSTYRHGERKRESKCTPYTGRTVGTVVSNDLKLTTSDACSTVTLTSYNKIPQFLSHRPSVVHIASPLKISIIDIYRLVFMFPITAVRQFCIQLLKFRNHCNTKLHSTMTRKATNMKSLSSEEINKFINSFDIVLTDCDGVLWMEMTPLPNSAEVMNTFQDVGKKVFYVTNNSTKTREEFAEKCKILNFKATEEDILCTSHLAANYLQNLSFHRKVYVIGKTGITKELEKVGITHCGIGPDPMGNDLASFIVQKDPEVGAVIVGYDEHFSYPKMVKAASYLADHDVHFIATNTDERFPAANNIVIPGTGSLVRCIETCAERKAIVMGKPEPYVADVIKRQYNVDPKRTLMIGDRANTDILLGTRCGFKTLLVLSGVTSLDDVEKWKHSTEKDDQDLVPDYYIDTLGDLFPHLQKYKSVTKK